MPSGLLDEFVQISTIFRFFYRSFCDGKAFPFTIVADSIYIKPDSRKGFREYAVLAYCYLSLSLMYRHSSKPLHNSYFINEDGLFFSFPIQIWTWSFQQRICGGVFKKCRAILDFWSISLLIRLYCCSLNDKTLQILADGMLFSSAHRKKSRISKGTPK